MAVIDCVVAPPGDQRKVYGAVPPAGVAVSVAETTEAQIVGLFTVTVGFAVSEKVPEPVPVQPFESVTVTE